MAAVQALSHAGPSGERPLTIFEQIIAAGGVGAVITGGFAWLVKRQDLKAIEHVKRMELAEADARHKIESAAELAKQKLEYEMKLLGHGEQLLVQDTARIGRLEATVSRLEQQVSHLQGRLEEEENANLQLRTDLATMTNQYNDVAKRCEGLMTENEKLRAKNEQMSKTIKFDANQLAQKVSDLEEIVMATRTDKSD